MRWISLLLLAGAALTVVRAEPPVLLDQAVAKWIGGHDQWAFTQYVREFDGEQVREERLERYDPSRPADRRWQLLTVNSQRPTPERREEWQKQKERNRLNPGKSLAEFFDFEHAAVVDETDDEACYHLPLRNDHRWLFPTDRVNLKVTINKATMAIDQIEVGIEEPFRVALGLGRVMNLEFDLLMHPSVQSGESDNPAAARPGGMAHAVMNKLGERVEYAWSDFRRVTPHPDNVIAAGPKA